MTRHCAVINSYGDIEYSVCITDEVDESVARDFCNDHINTCIDGGVAGAGKWVIREVMVAEISDTDTLRPMDTAPKDGTEVLLKVKSRAGIPGKFLVGHYMPGGHCIEDHPPISAGWYFWDGRAFDYAAEPIGWAPLPKEV